MDEKWAFVGKKQKNCDPSDPEDDSKGDQWDHTAIDVDSRMVVSLVVGKRNGETLQEAVSDFAERTGGSPPPITTDDCNTYPAVLLEEYGEAVVPPRTGRPGRPRKPLKRWPEGSAYATVNKAYRNGRVAEVKRKLVHGTQADLAQALQESSASDTINTSFVERQNGSDRGQNARKRRKTLEFSKDLALHIAVGLWVVFCYNFHHLHRGLMLQLSDDSFLHRTPAMALGIAEQPLSVAEILSTQIVGFRPSFPATPADFRPRHAAGPAP